MENLIIARFLYLENIADVDAIKLFLRDYTENYATFAFNMDSVLRHLIAMAETHIYHGQWCLNFTFDWDYMWSLPPWDAIASIMQRIKEWS